MAGAYVVTASLWKDAEGVRHRKGSLLDPPADQVARLLRAGAIKLADDVEDDSTDQGDAEAQQKAEAERVAAEQEAARKVIEQGKVPPRPKATATEPAWEKYATLRGIDTTGLDKDQLIAAVDKLDAK